MNLIKGSFIILSMTSVKWLISWEIVKVKYTIYFHTDAGTKTSGIFHPYLTDLTVNLQKSSILQASCAFGFADLKNEGAGKCLSWKNEVKICYGMRQLTSGSLECPQPAWTPVTVQLGTLTPQWRVTLTYRNAHTMNHVLGRWAEPQASS